MTVSLCVGALGGNILPCGLARQKANEFDEGGMRRRVGVRNSFGKRGVRGCCASGGRCRFGRARQYPAYPVPSAECSPALKSHALEPAKLMIHNQNSTVAANAMAERKTFRHLS